MSDPKFCQVDEWTMMAVNKLHLKPKIGYMEKVNILVKKLKAMASVKEVQAHELDEIIRLIHKALAQVNELRQNTKEHQHRQADG